ncbi:hypothetical protein ACFYT5_39860 [Streptomyces anulatus]|uniref:hypothetical protein n=1 Tax=Streptomyces anulatus TaxID=1892 RepID=UPI0036BDCC78
MGSQEGNLMHTWMGNLMHNQMGNRPDAREPARPAGPSSVPAAAARYVTGTRRTSTE